MQDCLICSDKSFSPSFWVDLSSCKLSCPNEETQPHWTSIHAALLTSDGLALITLIMISIAITIIIGAIIRTIIRIIDIIT